MLVRGAPEDDECAKDVPVPRDDDSRPTSALFSATVPAVLNWDGRGRLVTGRASNKRPPLSASTSALMDLELLLWLVSLADGGWEVVPVVSDDGRVAPVVVVNGVTSVVVVLLLATDGLRLG